MFKLFAYILICSIFILVDASQAGTGNLEIIVSVNGRNVPNYVQSEGNAKFKVNFKPTEPSTHLVSVKFNGESVTGKFAFLAIFHVCICLTWFPCSFNQFKGSPYVVKVIDSSQSLITGNALRSTSLSKGIDFSIENKNNSIHECTIQLTSKCNTQWLLII